MVRPPQLPSPSCHVRCIMSSCLQRRAIEDWHKNSTPIGVPPKNPVEEVAPEDESDEDDDEGTAVQCFVACSSVVVYVRAQALAYLKLSLWYQQRSEAGQAAQPGRCCPLACQVQCDDAGGCSLMRLDGLTSAVSWLDGCDGGLLLCCNSKVLLCICLVLRHLMHRPAGSDKDPKGLRKTLQSWLWCRASC